VLDDKFMEIVETIKECDLLILASPIWHHAVTGYMKVFVDRFAACMLVFNVDSDGKVTMIPRLDNMQGMCVLSGCTGDVSLAMHPLDIVFKAMNIEQREPLLLTKVGLTEGEMEENMKAISGNMYEVGKSI
jgi:FMN-dependent NADH-azoreductase